MRWRFLVLRTIVDSLTLLTFIIFLSLLNYKVKTFHFLSQNYEHATSLLLLAATTAIQSQSQSVYLFFKVLRGTDTECWAAFYSLSPYCGSGSVLAGFRLPGLRDHHQSRSRSWVGQGAAGLTGRGPGPAWRKRRVTTVRKISLVAPQQPLEQQRARGQECSENEQIIALQTRIRCIHNPKTKVKLRLRLTRWGSKFIVTFPRRDYPRIEELWNAFMERNNKRGRDLLQLTTINWSRKIRLLRNVKADLPPH